MDMLTPHQQRRLKERTMTLEKAREQFVGHFLYDEPNCVELRDWDDRPPAGTKPCCAEMIELTHFHAWACVQGEGQSPLWYVLASGSGEHESVYLWTRYEEA